MGHSRVLVIGDDAQDQLYKFQREEYADHTKNKYLIEIDILEQAKAEYMSDTERFLQDKDGKLHDPWDEQFWRQVADDEAEDVPITAPVVTRISPSGARKRQYVPADFRSVEVPTHELISFQDFVKKQYACPLLAEGEEPDLFKKHRSGWHRINQAGEVIEVKERTILDGIWDWFEVTFEVFKLKPGATGFNISHEQKQVAQNYAGAARKGDIDWQAMREQEAQQAAKLWDQAAAAHGGARWRSRKELDTASSDQHVPAWQQYYEQAAVKAMYAAQGAGPNVILYLDDFLLPRDAYIQMRCDDMIFQHFGYIVKDGEMIFDCEELCPSLQELNAMLEKLPEDAWLTAASVHA